MNLRVLETQADRHKRLIAEQEAALAKVNDIIQARWKALGGGKKCTFKDWEVDGTNVVVSFEWWDDHGHEKDFFPADIFAEPDENVAIAKHKAYLENVQKNLEIQVAAKKEREEKELLRQLTQKYAAEAPTGVY